MRQKSSSQKSVEIIDEFVMRQKSSSHPPLSLSLYFYAKKTSLTLIVDFVASTFSQQIGRAQLQNAAGQSFHINYKQIFAQSSLLIQRLDNAKAEWSEDYR
jgi:hypothetical protein